MCINCHSIEIIENIFLANIHGDRERVLGIIHTLNKRTKDLSTQITYIFY